MRKYLFILLAMSVFADVCAGTGAAAEADSLDQAVRELEEIVVKSDRYVRTSDGLTVRPDRNQTGHSTGGYELIRNLMLPGVSVDMEKGEVSALGGTVSLYIDGMAADYREIRQLRAGDVLKVEYIEVPSGKYAGDTAVLNFVMKKRDSGGYVALDGQQRIGYAKGDYNLAGKFFKGNTQYTLFAGTDYLGLSGAEAEKKEEIRFPGQSVIRDYTSDGSETSNSQYAQMRVRNKNDRRTLRATLSFVRKAEPENREHSSLTYAGIPDQPSAVAVTRNSSSCNFKYSLGLSGSFNLSERQFIEASASATASRNHYAYSYTESGGQVGSTTAEDFYNLSANFSYGIKFNRGNSLVFKLQEYYNVSSAVYEGSNSSRQHLWSSETMCFAEYTHRLWNRASLHVAPGMSMEFYRLRGEDRVGFIGPRLQAAFVVQPARRQMLQVVALYGNSFPQLSMMSGATQQVDMIYQRRGNPDLKVTKILNAIVSYGIGVDKVQFQASGVFKGAGHLPVATYGIEDGMLVESYAPGGEWRQLDAGVSATWTPSGNFNLQLSGGWLYNGYFRDVDISAACWKGSASAAWYFGDFSLNGHLETPQKIAGYDQIVTRVPWQYGLSVSWSRKSLRVEVGSENPFSRHPTVDRTLSTQGYSFKSSSYTPADRASVFVKLAWSLDFGKKTSHDRPNIDRNISTGVLQATSSAD